LYQKNTKKYQELKNILFSYAKRNISIGYYQGINTLVSFMQNNGLKEEVILIRSAFGYYVL